MAQWLVRAERAIAERSMLTCSVLGRCGRLPMPSATHVVLPSTQPQARCRPQTRRARGNCQRNLRIGLSPLSSICFPPPALHEQRDICSQDKQGCQFRSRWMISPGLRALGCSPGVRWYSPEKRPAFGPVFSLSHRRAALLPSKSDTTAVESECLACL
jgi:hypothetical protein